MSTSGRTVVAGLFALAAAGPLLTGPLHAQALGNGPFRVPEQHTVYALFLTPRPERADVLPAGTFELAWRSTYSNVFEFVRDPAIDVTLDYERWTNTFEVVWAPRDRVEVGVRSALVTGWGGFMDGLVQWYHARLALPNGDREDVADNEFEVSVVAAGDSILSLDGGTHLADPIVWVAVPIFRGRKALSARASVKLPVGDPDWSSGRVDVALQLDARHTFTDWATYAGAAIGTVNAGPTLDPFTASLAGTFHLGMERRLGRTWAAMVQFQGSTPFLRGFQTRELDRAPVNLGVGFTGRTGSNWLWQVAFTEDIRPDSPAVDFTLDLHLSRRVGGG